MFASMPKCFRVWTSAAAVRSATSLETSFAVEERRRIARSGSVYSSWASISPTSKRLGWSGSSVETGSIRSGEGWFSPTTSGKSCTASTGGSSERNGMTVAGSTWSSSGRARRARSCARRTACPERRTSAPAEAPESSSAPITSASTPTIVVPVEPTSRPKIPSRPRPVAPPWLAPSAARRPKVVTARPVRKGFTSTIELRATISAPTTRKAIGAT